MTSSLNFTLFVPRLYTPGLVEERAQGETHPEWMARNFPISLIFLFLEYYDLKKKNLFSLT
jgi:hypothetical protein